MAFETHVSVTADKPPLRVRYHPDLHEVEVVGEVSASEREAFDRMYEDVLTVVSEIWSDERNMNMRDDAGEVF